MISTATALFFWKSATTPKSLVATRVVPFSGAAGREDTPTLAPDGKQIVYAWDGDEGTTTDIYLRLITGGEPVQLTKTAAKEHYPVFSPDGSQIAFVRDLKTHGEVFLIPALGGTERRVCRLFSGNFSISFAPDGNSIAVIDTVDSTNKKQYAVYLIDLRTGDRRRLTAPAEFQGETTPRFSPDGKSIAFVRVLDDQGRIYSSFRRKIESRPSRSQSLSIKKRFTVWRGVRTERGFSTSRFAARTVRGCGAFGQTG